MTIIRYAVLTAVSTKAQAASDKVSLDEQLATCRERGARRGWIETAGPFVIPGQSRTRYVDLSKAEKDIPALREMLDQARDRKFDVLAIFEYNRLRDLLDLVSIVLNGYGIQIFSATQPIEPMPPEEFKPYLASTQDVMQSMSKVISKRQADDLRIKYETGMSGRVTRLGLPARIPYGYKKPAGREWDPKAVPVQDPDQVQTLLHMKDMLLAGQSIRQIRAWLDENKIPSPGGKGQWYPNMIRATLLNPFYAGRVRWGISRVVFDARERKTRKNTAIPEDEIITGPGAHEPIWDEATHQAIVSELKRRGRSYRGMVANQLTGLLKCGVCGATMRIYRSGFWKSPLGRQAYLRCAVGSADHASIRFTKAVELLADELVRSLQENQSSSGSDKTAQLEDLDKQIDDLTARRTRLVDAYEAGLLDLTEYGQRRKTLDAQLGECEQRKRELDDNSYSEVERAAVLDYLRANIDSLRNYILDGERQEVNHTLRLIIDHATFYNTEGGKRIELTFK